MATITSIRKASKTVQVIARIAFKRNPRAVVYLVRSSNGQDIYRTALYDGKAVSCEGCPSHASTKRPCYHMTQLERREQERRDAERTAFNNYELGLGA